MENTGSNIGSIISKKNGMFVSADNDGNIREAGIGNPITECSFIAAPNSIINNINGTYYTPLSTYITDIIEYYIRPIYNKLDPDPEMSIDGIDDNKLTFNITNYSNKEISLNIVNIKGNINYSDIKWYIKYNIKETDNIQDIIDKSYNDNNNLDLPCKLKYAEGYTNTVIYNSQYFDDIILVYAKASITRLDGTPGTCSDYVLLQCDTNQEMIKNSVYTFHYNKVSETALFTAALPTGTDPSEPSTPEQPETPENPDDSTTLQSPLPEPTLLPHCHYLSYGSYLYPDSYIGSIDLYTRSYPYSYSYLTISYNDTVNNIEVYSVINGTYTNLKNGDTLCNNDITDILYSYNPIHPDSYRIQLTNGDLKNKIYISYCSYSRFKPTSESDTNFINRIQIDSTWGSKSENNIYSTYFNIYGDEIKKRPAKTNGLSISCNYKLDISSDKKAYITYIPNDTDKEHPATIEFTLNKDFGYNYDDSYYYYKIFKVNEWTKLANNTGWILYPNIKDFIIEKDNEFFSIPKIKTNLFASKITNDSVKQNLYYFQYQQQHSGDEFISPKIFQNDYNKVSIDIYNIPDSVPDDSSYFISDDSSYLPLTILFTTNVNNEIIIGNNNYSANVYEVLNVNIFRNPTLPPVPTTKKPEIDPDIRV